MDCWHILGIAPTRDEAAIKRAYAQLLKKHRPDRDPDGFIRLREAYEAALAGGEQYDTFAHDDEAAPLLDARAIRRSWRQAKDDDTLLALLQSQSAALPTIDEQLDYRDLIASWIEARDRPQRYPQSLIWIIEKYRLLRGLPDDDPLYDDYLRALIHTGARDKVLRVLARRAPELGAWLALSGWRQRRYGLGNNFVLDDHRLIDIQLARLQTTHGLDDRSMSALFPAARRLQAHLRLPHLALAALAALLYGQGWWQTALCLALILAHELWWLGVLAIQHEKPLPAAPAPLYAGMIACYAVLATFAPPEWLPWVAALGVTTALAGFSRIPADDPLRRSRCYGGILLGIALTLVGDAPWLAWYWLLPCGADLARRYRDYDLTFLHLVASLCYLTLLAALAVQLWQRRLDAPFAIILAFYFVANAAAWYFVTGTTAEDDNDAP